MCIFVIYSVYFYDIVHYYIFFYLNHGILFMPQILGFGFLFGMSINGIFHTNFGSNLKKIL